MKKLILTCIILITILTSTGCSSSQAIDNPVNHSLSLSGNGCVVLNYHRIRTPNFLMKTLERLTNNSELNTYSVYSDVFEEQLLYLKKKGIPFITPKQLKSYISHQQPMPKKCVLVTFDDIDVSVYENAYPFLKKEGIPFTVFIVTGEAGNSNFDGLNMYTWNQLKEMQKSGLITIGTHTHKLHYLEKDGTPPFLKDKNLEAFKRDALKETEVYKQQFGTEPRYFAYPYGLGTPKTDEFLLSQKYDLLFSLNSGIVQANSPSFFINRVLVDKVSWKAVEKWANA